MNSKLFSSLQIKDVLFKNRLAVSPMCMYSSSDGFANDWHLVHLGTRAVGGAGLVMTEAAAVSPEGRITPDDLGIWKEDHIAGLSRITSFIEENGSIAGIQLAHAGRKASTSSPWKGGATLSKEEDGWQPKAPSPIPFRPTDPAPSELQPDEIKAVIASFKTAAKRALKAGFKVVEIHAAHGYLLHEFLSPLSNQRNDRYGGTFENRIRLLLEVIREVRTVWPLGYPLFLRISTTDWAEGGWTEEASLKLALEVKQLGVDLIDCSSGGLVPHAKIPLTKGYQVDFSQHIRKDSGILTAAVGLITEAEEAEGILSQGKADMIFMAREFLRNPYFPLEAARKLGADIAWPSQYDRAKLPV